MIITIIKTTHSCSVTHILICISLIDHHNRLTTVKFIASVIAVHFTITSITVQYTFSSIVTFPVVAVITCVYYYNNNRLKLLTV